MTLTVRLGDLADPAVQALVRLHLAGMHADSPPGHVQALDDGGLRDPVVTLWTAWQGPTLAGMAALRMVSSDHAELKSMRTHPDHLRQGVARALLDAALAEARRRGVSIVSLETGSGPAFAPALALYERAGFRPGAAFGDYPASDFSQFWHLALHTPP